MSVTKVAEHCQHEGCEQEGIACWLPYDPEAGVGGDDPDAYYCHEHINEEGFCWGCGLFWAGCEDFDFDPRGLCSNCRSDPDITGDEFKEVDFDFLDPPFEFQEQCL